MPEANDNIVMRSPEAGDGARIYQFVKECPPLEVNTLYAYLLLATHFSGTCVVAEDESGMLGFVVGYRLPESPDTLFVWQIAVGARARGTGMGKKLLQHLVERRTPEPVRFLEATVATSNTASQRLFRGFAKSKSVPCEEQPYFEPEHFGGDEHEAEALFHLGPFR